METRYEFLHLSTKDVFLKTSSDADPAEAANLSIGPNPGFAGKLSDNNGIITQSFYSTFRANLPDVSRILH